jgi:hypothetical protein
VRTEQALNSVKKPGIPANARSVKHNESHSKVPDSFPAATINFLYPSFAILWPGGYHAPLLLIAYGIYRENPGYWNYMTMQIQEKKPADALLLIGPGCPHCPGVLEALGNLIKEGVVGTLEVVNVAIHPQRATAVGTRTVPWVRIGLFELEGALTPDELRLWAERASEASGVGAYLSHLLENQRLDKALALIRATPSILDDLVTLLEQEDTPLVVRIGVGAVMEELEGSGLLNQIFEQLVRLTQAPEPNLRADACHYLALSANPDATPVFRRLLQDEDPDVREIARESLETLGIDSPLH